MYYWVCRECGEAFEAQVDVIDILTEHKAQEIEAAGLGEDLHEGFYLKTEEQAM